LMPLPQARVRRNGATEAVDAPRYFRRVDHRRLAGERRRLCSERRRAGRTRLVSAPLATSIERIALRSPSEYLQPAGSGYVCSNPSGSMAGQP